MNIVPQEEYIEHLVKHLITNSLSSGKDPNTQNNPPTNYRLTDGLKAFKYLLSLIPKELTTTDIIETANLVNKNSPYISNGYRKIGQYLADTPIRISSPPDISKQMSKLLTDYQTLWKNLNIFEKEALFHIKFIKIHPFEDGNGRTSRLLLNYHLIANQIPPVIITSDLLNYYHSYIENEDVTSLTNLFKIQSQKSSIILNNLNITSNTKPSSQSTLTK